MYIRFHLHMHTARAWWREEIGCRLVVVYRQFLSFVDFHCFDTVLVRRVGTKANLHAQWMPVSVSIDS